MLHAEWHGLISSLYPTHFLLHASALFIGVCKIAIGATVCARLIPTRVGIGTRHLTRPFCACFALCVDMLRVVCASREDLVFVAGLFQPKLELRRVWWLCCRVYSLR